MHRERFENIALLRHPADTGGSALVRGQFMQHDAAQMDGAAMLAGGAGQRVHERGFTGAVASQQRHGLAFAQRNGHVVEHHSFTVTGA